MPANLSGLKREAGGIAFTWDDGLVAVLSPWKLRVNCPCALCVSEASGTRILDPESVDKGILLKDMQSVGRYAYRCLFGDGHDTGIFTLEILRQLCESAG